MDTTHKGIDFLILLYYFIFLKGETSCSFLPEIAAVEAGSRAVAHWAAVASWGGYAQRPEFSWHSCVLGGWGTRFPFLPRHIPPLGEPEACWVCGPRALLFSSGLHKAPSWCQEDSYWGHQQCAWLLWNHWEFWLHFFFYRTVGCTDWLFISFWGTNEGLL